MVVLLACQGAPLRIALSQLTAEPMSIDFGDVPVGETREATVELINGSPVAVAVRDAFIARNTTLAFEARHGFAAPFGTQPRFFVPTAPDSAWVVSLNGELATFCGTSWTSMAAPATGMPYVLVPTPGRLWVAELDVGGGSRIWETP